MNRLSPLQRKHTAEATGAIIKKRLKKGDHMSKSNTVKQVFQLLWEKKAWWLVPMVVVFLLVGALLVATQGSALSPFIYALF